MAVTHTGESVVNADRRGAIQLNDAEAVQRLQRGDQIGFDHLYTAYARPAIRTALLITRSQTAAEDAVQEAFVRVLRSISTLRAAASFRPWFYRIVVNGAKRLARTGPVQTVPLEVEHHDQADPTVPAPDEVALTDEEAVRLRIAISGLSEAHRVPVFLFYFTGLSEQEIAQAMSLPVGTVKSRLHNARKRLLAGLEGERQVTVSFGATARTERVTQR